MSASDIPVEKVGIEPTPTTLARRVRSLSCHPQEPPWQAAASCLVLTLWRYQHAGTFTPEGGASQGREDSNPRRAVLEAAVLAAELRPYLIEKRPSGGFPAGGFRSADYAYPEASPARSVPLGWACEYDSRRSVTCQVFMKSIVRAETKAGNEIKRQGREPAADGAARAANRPSRRDTQPFDGQDERGRLLVHGGKCSGVGRNPVCHHKSSTVMTPPTRKPVTAPKGELAKRLSLVTG
jgi:hypothetical protein